MMSGTKKDGPEFPADLEWSQGAKNPRKAIQHRGTPMGDTTTNKKHDDVSGLEENWDGTLPSDTDTNLSEPASENEDPFKRRDSIRRTPPKMKKGPLMEVQKAQHSRIAQQMQSFKKSPNEGTWQEIFKCLKRMEEEDRRRDELLIDVRNMIEDMKPRLLPNYPTVIKEGVPGALSEIRQIEIGIEKAKQEKATLSRLLQQMREEKSTTTEVFRESSTIDPRARPNNGTDPKKWLQRTKDLTQKKSNVTECHRSEGGRPTPAASKTASTSPTADQQNAEKKANTGANSQRQMKHLNLPTVRTVDEISDVSIDNENESPRTPNLETKGWETPHRRNYKKKRKKMPRNEAISVKPAPERSYAEVLGLIRQKVNPENHGVTIKKVSKSRAGEVLLEIQGESVKSRGELTTALQAALDEAGTVRELVPKRCLEIRDLDAYTTPDEVKEAIRMQYPSYNGTMEARVTRPNNRGQVLAVVTLDELGALKMLETAKIKVGWVICRIRPYKIVKRCFKCLGYGHESYTCNGTNRSKCCFKCGSEGHKAKQCNEEPKCFLCLEATKNSEECKHIAGSGACGVFKHYLREEKKKP